METKNSSSSDNDDSDDDEVKLDPVDSCRSISALTQKRKLVPYYGVHRDKESLLEEVQALQEAFQDQKFHFQAHKQHHNALQAENSRLESQIEYLETSGLEAPRTGTLTKLKSKRNGCKFRLMELKTTCVANDAEVRKLRMDTQFLRTQEATVQRDMFALEVRRLQRLLFHLNNVYKKVCDDNQKAIHLKEKIGNLTAKNQELKTCVYMKRKSLEEMTMESLEWTGKGVAAKTACARHNSRFKSLQEESKSIMDMLFKEKLEKANFTTMVNTLAHEVRLAEKENRQAALRIA